MKNDRKPAPNQVLNDFGDLKRALRHASQEAAAQKVREQAEQARRMADQRGRQADQDLFKQAVGAVHRLTPTARMALSPPRPAPVPRLRLEDEAAVLREAISDDFDVESLLETDESLSWRRPEVGPDVVRKLRRGVWTLQGQLDLHGMRSDEARERLIDFLRESQQKGWRCVRVVHGKGLGSPGRQSVLKDKTRRWLVQNERVLAFVQARADEGGTGALMVLLNAPT